MCAVVAAIEGRSDVESRCFEYARDLSPVNTFVFVACAHGEWLCAEHDGGGGGGVKVEFQDVAGGAGIVVFIVFIVDGVDVAAVADGIAVGPVDGAPAVGCEGIDERIRVDGGGADDEALVRGIEEEGGVGAATLLWQRGQEGTGGGAAEGGL